LGQYLSNFWACKNEIQCKHAITQTQELTSVLVRDFDPDKMIEMTPEPTLEAR
jgi:hypothetical protein